MIDNNEDIATALCQFFETTFIEEILDHMPELPERTIYKLSDITITEQSVLSGLLCLHNNKTPGPDKIHPCLLKNVQAVSVNLYTTCLINHYMLVNFPLTGKRKPNTYLQEGPKKPSIKLQTSQFNITSCQGT